MAEDLTEPAGRGATPSPGRSVSAPGVPGSYEYLVLTLPPGTSRADARRVLTDHAEYGHWELARVQLAIGGVRRVWLRRRIIRVSRTA
jgi:hypothetical protein